MVDTQLANNEDILKYWQQVVHQPAWGVKLGVGSFLTIEFGKKPAPSSHGVWHFWVYGCAWRLEIDQNLRCGSQDSREWMAQEISKLEGEILQTVLIDPLSLDLKLQFTNQKTLTLFSVSAEDMEHWLLYMPDNIVLVAGPKYQAYFDKNDRHSKLD